MRKMLHPALGRHMPVHHVLKHSMIHPISHLTHSMHKMGVGAHKKIYASGEGRHRKIKPLKFKF